MSAMQGWRKSMEDAHLALPDFDTEKQFGLFGVFDGHGGAAVSKLAAMKLPEVLRALPNYKAGRYEQALQDAFLCLDAYLDSAEGRQKVQELAADGPVISDDDEDDEQEVLQQLIATGQVNMKDLEGEEEEGAEDDEDDDDEGEEEEPDSDYDMEESEEEEGNNAWANGEGPDGMGTTAVVALIRSGNKPEIYCANAGDSRCVLARGRKALNMSRDHKPTLKSERTRIVKAGGFVTTEGRVDGNLNLSRALGDFAYKKDTSLKPTEQKISCEAEVRHRMLIGSDKYLLIGCDGIFEKASSQQLVDFVLPRLRQGKKSKTNVLTGACSAFLDYNIAKIPAKEQGLGCDNMTLMVVKLGSDSDASNNGSSNNGSSLVGKFNLRKRLLNGRSAQGVRRTIGKNRVPSAGRRRLILRAYQQRGLH